VNLCAAQAGVSTSPDQGEARAAGRGDALHEVKSSDPIGGEQLLRALAAGDARSLQATLSVPPSGAWPPEARRERVLPVQTSALVRLAALLSVGGSTNSLHWAVELATRAGAGEEEIIEVLATVAAVVGSARVVAAAPRLALAMGLDIEIDGWDGT